MFSLSTIFEVYDWSSYRNSFSLRSLHTVCVLQTMSFFDCRFWYPYHSCSLDETTIGDSLRVAALQASVTSVRFPYVKFDSFQMSNDTMNTFSTNIILNSSRTYRCTHRVALWLSSGHGPILSYWFRFSLGSVWPW